MIHFGHLATKLFNVPLALHPAKAEVVMAALSERLGISHIVRANGTSAPLAPPDLSDDDGWAADKPYQVIDGVAIVPVTGTLVQKLGCIRPYSGMTGYDGIRAMLAGAIDDSEVRGIMLDIDSPGGEVAGVFDLADAIFAARDEKPIWAVLNEAAYSAAYAIASAASYITVPRTGGCGSIGVITMMVDMSRAMQAGGMTVNIIQFGARKADGNEFEPLPKEARARFQADIDALGKLFCDTVARNRDIPFGVVIDTEADTFMGSQGVALKLADAVMAPDAAFRALCALVN
jgi:capsid assembly protease